MRGAENDPVITPSKVPRPPTSIAPVGPLTALMTLESTRSLSCQSWLVTWKGNADVPFDASRPLKLTYVNGVEAQLSSNVYPSESITYSTSAASASGVIGRFDTNGRGSSWGTLGTAGRSTEAITAPAG